MVEPPARWFVGFVDNAHPRPWNWLTRRGFRHSLCIYYMPERDCWWFLEWSSYRLYVEPLEGEQVDSIFYMLRKSGTCVEINSQELPPPTRHGTIPIYCVSWIKQLLGLRGFILTPYQLFCALKRYGGTVIYTQEGENHGRFIRRRIQDARCRPRGGETA